MTKRIFFTTALILSTVVSFAQNLEGTKVITNPDTVKITNNQDRISVEVKKGDIDYKFERKLSEENITVIKEKNNEFNFGIPFIDKKQKEKNSQGTYPKSEFYVLKHMEYGMGLVTATNQADGMDVKMANCGWEFIFNNLFGGAYHITKQTSLKANFGLDWRNYRMKNENRFLKENNKLTIAPYPDGADVEFSRVKIFSMTLEFLMTQQINKKIFIAAGPVVNFNTHGSIKTRYTLDGKGKKETSSCIKQNAVTLDYKAEVGFANLGFYFKYSPSNVLDTNYGPKFKSMSAGIIYHIY